ncbi:hypothetical protein MRX96_034833 [Rhipicephalus microplus]
MSAHEQMRQMLDQLMGTGRDGENNRYKVHFTDPRVCKSFLLACCPHDILASTRMDLGDCPKIHDLALRADYENASAKKDYFYDVDAMEHLQNFIGECDRRTEQAKRRLAETQEELSAEVTLKLNRVHELAENMGKKLAAAEAKGADGNVEESLKLLEEVEEIRRKKAEAEQDYRNSHACLVIPTAKVAGVRRVLRLPGHPRQRPPARRPLWWQAAPGLHCHPSPSGPPPVADQPRGEAGRTTGAAAGVLLAVVALTIALCVAGHGHANGVTGRSGSRDPSARHRSRGSPRDRKRDRSREKRRDSRHRRSPRERRGSRERRQERADSEENHRLEK